MKLIDKYWAEYLRLYEQAYKRFWVYNAKKRGRYGGTLHTKKIDVLQDKILNEMLKDGCHKSKVLNRFCAKRNIKIILYMAKKGYTFYLKVRDEPHKKRKKANLNYHSCLLCKSTKNLQQHHIKPLNETKNKRNYNSLKRRGYNARFNVVWLCKKCHIEKIHKGRWGYFSKKYIKILTRLNPYKKR